MLTSLILALAFALSTPCEFEDSTNCTWVAASAGNTQGQSFTDFFGITLKAGN